MAYAVTKSGLHYAVIYEGTDAITGRERRRWHRCANRDDAEALACKLSNERARLRRAGSTMTLREFFAQHLPTREPTLTAKSYAGYVDSVERYLLPHLGHVQLRQLHAGQLGSLYQRLLTTGSARGGPLSAKTVNNLHQVIHHALEHAIRRNLLIHNPADGIRPPDPRRRPSPARKARSWTAAELSAFLAATAEHRHAMFFRLAAATGMRRGELVGLRWHDVHLDTGRIEVTQAVTITGATLSFSLCKTRTSRRNITLDPDSIHALRAWRDRQAQQLEGVGATNQRGLVFTSTTGDVWHPDCASQTFRRALDGIDVTPIRLHDLRHTHASLLLRDRVPIKVVSERLGHANPAFTMTTYQHVLPGMQDDAARRFGHLLTSASDHDGADGGVGRHR